MPQAPQSSEIAIPLGGLPAGSQDFKFFGRNVLRVSFLFVPDSGQCVTLTNSGVFVQPMESGTRQRLLNRIAHDIRFDADAFPPQVNQGDEGFTVWAGLDALAGTLFYWVDHSLSQINLGDSMCGCDDECAESGPCANTPAFSTFYDDFHSVFITTGVVLDSNEHWSIVETGNDPVPEQRSNGWVYIPADGDLEQSSMETFNGTFAIPTAPARALEMEGRVFVEAVLI